VDAVNQLLSNQVGGQPQSTLMSQSLTGLTAQQQDTIMILHAPNHWVTVAATEGEVIYVDSLRPHQQISPYVTRQLLQLFPQHIGGDGKLTMSVVPSTPQTNGEDCGVFAAAYATELLFGDGRRGLQAAFDVPAMRGHLEQCLEKQQMSPFPRRASKGAVVSLR